MWGDSESASKSKDNVIIRSINLNSQICANLLNSFFVAKSAKADCFWEVKPYVVFLKVIFKEGCKNYQLKFFEFYTHYLTVSLHLKP